MFFLLFILHYYSTKLSNLETSLNPSFPCSDCFVPQSKFSGNSCIDTGKTFTVANFLKMPSPTDFETKVQVLAFHDLHLPTHKIVEKLSESGIKISERTVIRSVNSAEKEKYGQRKNQKRLREQNQPTARFSENVRKEASAVNRANPPIQNQLASRLGISQSSVNRILSQDLNSKTRKKRHVHNLTEKQTAQLLDLILDLLEDVQSRTIFTMDEIVNTLNNLNVGRNFYYEEKKNAVSEDWKKLRRKLWPAQIMVAIGVSRAYVVPEASKVNAEFF